ncbi:hypothetical protein L486_03650 [Kwoniella mangroviensis CBS 10435]|uniref:Uncharacterized protein n=1 Tax=Kwoniella mangroviensis CBS 10435 TaxID=1331196 RepID=A0A1B9IUD3_9TREE|nr:uncharacterized protein I203_02335 [Kwoniella mangroviensis CBS 8507]OCF59149.1 hypothetical protein L486_03650 [Kwoniella mangroviensis CBS 10435]OCF68941.1 hypothetical protein I203_02335 [Kwoniella mangroviensis CBS 8507]
MPSPPLTIPSRPSVSSTSTITSSSYEERRISQPTLISSSPSTPLIISFCSSSSTCSSSMRRSSSAPHPRRGSSLPSIPSSVEVEDSNTSGPRMDILQFISSTIDPTWDEIESSPLSMVPSILPSTTELDVDLVTFLREAPGVVRSPLSDSVTSFEDNSQIGNDEEEAYGEDEMDIDMNKLALVTPELKQVSLRTFLEEEHSRYNTHFPGHGHGHGMENSPNPSLSISEIYGLGGTSSRLKLNTTSFDRLDNTEGNQLTMTEFLNGSISRPSTSNTSRSRISTFDHLLLSRSSSNTDRSRSRSSTMNSGTASQKHKRVVSLTNKNPPLSLGLGLHVSSDENTSNRHHSHGVGKVMKFARDAFKIGNNGSHRS